MKDICSECGDLKILTADGVCANRHGCEHRQYQHREAVARLTAEMDRQARYNAARARHPAKGGGTFPISKALLDDVIGWGGGESLLDSWRNHPSGTPERTNYWIDQWLSRPEYDDEDE